MKIDPTEYVSAASLQLFADHDLSPVYEAPQESGMIILGVFLTSFFITRIYKNGIAKYWKKIIPPKTSPDSTHPDNQNPG